MKSLIFLSILLSCLILTFSSEDCWPYEGRFWYKPEYVLTIPLCPAPQSETNPSQPHVRTPIDSPSPSSSDGTNHYHPLLDLFGAVADKVLSGHKDVLHGFNSTVHHLGRFAELLIETITHVKSTVSFITIKIRRFFYILGRFVEFVTKVFNHLDRLSVSVLPMVVLFFTDYVIIQNFYYVVVVFVIQMYMQYCLFA